MAYRDKNGNKFRNEKMTKRVSAKYKINRRLMCNLWGRPKSPFNKREYRPGEHGQARRRKPSDFGIQLSAKQMLKGYYGNITEKQFRRIYDEAVRRKGDTSQNIIGLLERRLDAVVYRMKYVPTVFSARQFISHGHVRVNGKKVNIPSYRVSEGDVIDVREKSREIPMVLEAIESPEREVPEYIEVDQRALRGTFLRTPQLAEVPYPVQMEPNLVIEFYSR
jgi:small subunit ribosomal protein S4